MSFEIIKKGSNNFWHVWNSGLKNQSISDFEAIIDDAENTFSIMLRNGANVPQMKLLVSDVIVTDEVLGTTNTYATGTELRNALVLLGYTPYLGAGNADSISGLIVQGTNVTITGSGTISNPYIINSSGGGGSITDASLGTAINGFTEETIVDADNLTFSDVSDSNKAKKITGTSFKAFLKTYFDTLYTTTSAVATQISTALSGYATQSWVNSQGFQTASQVISYVNGLGYQTASQVNSLITSALATFKTANFLDATSSIQTQINDRLLPIAVNDISATSTIVGWSSFNFKIIVERRFGNGQVLVDYFIEGVSNSVNASFTTSTNHTSTQIRHASVLVANNSIVLNTNGVLVMNNNSNIVTFNLNNTTANFTGSNNKAVRGQFIYKE